MIFSGILRKSISCAVIVMISIISVDLLSFMEKSTLRQVQGFSDIKLLKWFDVSKKFESSKSTTQLPRKINNLNFSKKSPPGRPIELRVWD